MKFGDRLLQRWRIGKADRWIRPNSRLLDIGCDDGAIFVQLEQKLAPSIGVDPGIENDRKVGKGQLIRGLFPEALPDDSPFDAVTMLAVLEHIPKDSQEQMARDIARFLKPGGRLIITVPSPLVDHVLVVLRFLRIVDASTLDEHFGYRPSQTPQLFGSAGLHLLKAGRFQLGLNHLFVFEKPAA